MKPFKAGELEHALLDKKDTHEKIDLAWKILSKMICLFFFMVFTIIIVLAVVIPMALMYTYTETDQKYEVKPPLENICPSE